MTIRASFSRRAFCRCCAGLAAWPLAAAATPDGEGLPQALELGAADMQRIDRTVWVVRLAPGVWLHTTTALIDGGFYYPANGLVLERAGGSLLIDAGTEPEQAMILLDWAARALLAPITEAVGTHFHSDRIGGVTGLEHRRVVMWAHPLTCALAKSRGVPAPRPIEDFKGDAHAFGAGCELYFPGPGHTRDNITAWLPEQKVLFGGCLLKSETSLGLGNVADADMGEWAASVRRLAARHPDARLVIPGHGTISGNPVGRTLALLSAPAAAGPGRAP